MRASKGTRLPSAASTDIEPLTIGAGEQVFRREQCLERERGRDLRAIQQCEPLLRAEHQWFDARVLQCLCAVQFLPAHANATFSDQREGEMRERRKITRRANRALARHQWMDAGIDKLQQPLDQHRPHAGVTTRETRGLQHENEAHRGIGERRTDAGRMRTHEIELQCRKFIGRDAGLRELAETGVDAVERLAGGEALADRGQRLVHALAPALRECDLIIATCQPAKLSQRDRARFQCECRHFNPPTAGRAPVRARR